MSKAHHFVFLDGLRGVAALAVVIMHFTLHGGHPAYFASAPLAVDLFFCLSGFVIAWSYYQKLVDGMSFFTYAKKRLIRLYPMFLIGLITGISAFLIKLDFGTNKYELSEFIIATIVNSVFLPYFVASVPDRVDSIFLLNPPFWSLFFELLANLLFVFTVKLSKSMLMLLTILFAILIVCAALLFNTSPGWSTTNFIGGFPRVGYSFMVGVLIFKFFKTSSVTDNLNPYVIMAALMILLYMPLSQWVYYWIFSTLLLMPIIVWLGARVEITQALLTKVMVYLGWISYPIYCLHYPMIEIWDSINPSPTHFYRGLFILFILTIVITHLVAKYIDEPVRAWLTSVNLSKNKISTI